MWFRSFGRNKGQDTAVASAPATGTADPDSAELDALSDLSPDTGLPQMPTINGGSTRDISTPTEALTDMWSTVENDDDDIEELILPAAGPSPAIAAVAAAEDDTADAGFERPVGWLVVVDGPGRGADFPIGAGVSPIGRNPDEVVALDFGDTSIAQYGHASVAYDEKSNAFSVSHGGKKANVRLNGKSVITTTKMTSHDRLSVGETTLMFVALCGKAFHWGAVGGDR